MQRKQQTGLRTTSQTRISNIPGAGTIAKLSYRQVRTSPTLIRIRFLERIAGQDSGKPCSMLLIFQLSTPVWEDVVGEQTRALTTVLHYCDDQCAEARKQERAIRSNICNHSNVKVSRVASRRMKDSRTTQHKLYHAVLSTPNQLDTCSRCGSALL